MCRAGFQVKGTGCRGLVVEPGFKNFLEMAWPKCCLQSSAILDHTKA